MMSQHCSHVIMNYKYVYVYIYTYVCIAYDYYYKAVITEFPKIIMLAQYDSLAYSLDIQ